MPFVVLCIIVILKPFQSRSKGIKRIKNIFVYCNIKIGRVLYICVEEPPKEKKEMANITKNQIKARLKKLIEKLEDAKSELEDLQTEIEDEIDNIEPYENKDELTEQQEERQEWLEDAKDTIETQVENLDELICELDYID